MNRSQIMAAIRSKNTRPEIVVRRIIHAKGYRFSLHRSDLPGKPDIVLPSRKKIIFVHGCFWHVHGCALSHIPTSNVRYWRPKLKRNQQRDLEHLKALRAAGWKCLVLWECELRKPEPLVRRLLKFLG